ncbi:MAG: T9SS type A sorting domain-containing protein [Ignavibacteriales bacterium]|nr:MAG: T9SS type A sorting domain-containing protein [Ignavibacteriales bacterium]
MQQSLYKYFCAFLLIAVTVFSSNLFGQPYNIPGDYATIQAAITFLNSNPVPSGGITFNVAAGHTETISDSLILTATGTSSDPIVFQKNGGGLNPKITRTDAGTRATSTFAAQGDAVIIIQGSDYVTFDGIDVAANDQGIEYGYFLRRGSDVDGCKFVTIKNATVDLTKGTSAFVIGIYSSNLVEGSPLNSSTGIVLTSTGGRHENVTLTGNTIQDVHAGIVLRGYVHTTPFDFYDQNFTIGQNGAGNIIQNYGGGSNTTSYAVYMIYHNNLSVGYNTINNTAGGGSGFTSTGYGIFTSTATSSNLNVINNTVTVTSIATTSSLAAISSSSGSTAAGNTLNFNNNIVTNCSYTTATTGTFDAIVATGSAAIVNLNSNTVSNNVQAGTGLFTCIEAGSPTTLNMNNNTVNGNQKTGASGTLYCTRAATSIITYSSNNIFNNSFTASSGTSSCILYGYYNISSPTEEYIFNNNIYDLSVAGTNTGTSSILYGIHTNTVAAAVKEIYDNDIYNLSAQSGTVYGISQLLGANVRIYKNSIYNLSNASTVTTTARTVGIQISSGTVYAYNNFISDLKAPNSTSIEAIRGISITSSTSTSTIGLYFNTIFLNASGGANFGTSGIYHTLSATTTTASLDMRNNIIVNNSTPSGTGLTVAFRRSSATSLNNYSETSNNNDFYAGTPGASNLIFYDGTNSDQNLGDFKNRVTPRETSSFTENPPFINSAVAPYNLHLSTLIATQTESGGTPVTTPIAVTDDFDGITRNAVTPDVGADEFSGIGADFTPPTISYTSLANTGSLTNRSLVVNITDASGVPTTAPGWPILYWRINAGSWTAATPVSVSGSDYTYNFGAGVVLGDVVSYYVVAQDVPGNVTALPSAGAGGFTTNPPAASTPPTTPYSYTIVSSPLAGDYTVGLNLFNSLTGKNISFEKVTHKVMKQVWFENPLSEAELKSEIPVEPTGFFQLMEVEEITWKPMQNGVEYTGDLYVKRSEYPQLNFPDGIEGLYATITAAVQDLNVRGISAATNFLLVDATYPTETFPITIDIANEYLPSAVNPFTIKPNTGVTATVSGISASSIFKLNGADYITFDGSNSGTSSRNLTIENTSTGTNTAVFWISSLGDGAGASNNTIKNCIVKSGSNTVTSTFGIYSGGATISTTGTGSDNDNLTVQNNEVIKSYRAVYSRGTTSGLTDGLNITQNTIGSSNVDDYVLFRGVDITNASSPNVSNNTIFNFFMTATGSIAGIELGTNVTDATLSKNYIHTLETNNTGGYGAYGIFISSGTGTSGITIANNSIAGLRTYGDGNSTTFNPFGIRITGGTGHKVYFNSINMFGAFSEPDTNNISAAIEITSNTVTGLDIRNNIFANSMTGAVNSKVYSIYAVTGVTFGTINNNDYFVSGSNGVLGFLSVDIPTLTGWKFASGQDASSYNANPLFTGNLNLHINSGLTPTVLESGGATIAGINTDFDNDARPGPVGSVNGGATAPDIGVDEFDGVPSVPMVYASSTVTQTNTGYLLNGSTNNEIIGIQVVTTGANDPLILESLSITTTGTTNLADITNAKVWYSGTSPVFATAVQFGTTLAVPTASFSVTGSQALVEGTNYFWLTFDLPANPTGGNTVDAQCNSITLSTTPYTPTVTNPAGNRSILGVLSGNYNVGTSHVFTSLTNAVVALNTNGVSGAVTFNLTDANYSTGETFPVTINQVTGASAVNTITIKPAASVTTSVVGTAASIIKLNGADYIIIDGSNSGGTDRSLTITNNSTSTSSAAVWVSSLGTGAGAENNTIKNCNISAGSNSVTSTFGIIASGTTISTSGTGAGNNDLNIINNNIIKSYYAIFTRGVASTGLLTGLNISNNLIGSNVFDDVVTFRGIDITNATAPVVSQNEIFNMQIATSVSIAGIDMGTNVTDAMVSRNKIYGLRSLTTSAYGAYGINISSGTGTSGIQIVNNLIYDLIVDGDGTSTTFNAFGIRITGGANHKVYYNSVNLFGALTGTTSTTADISAALIITSSTVTGIDIRDNIFSNSITGINPNGVKSYSEYVAAGTTLGTSNYNNNYVSGANGIFGYFAADILTLAAWRTATGQDLNSIDTNPAFNSNSNLVPQIGSPVLDAGTPIAGVTIDFSGVIRDVTNPSIGAYENGADAVGPEIIYAAFVNTTSTSNRILTDVTINDFSGVNVTTFKPRIYYKKSTDADVFGGNTSGDNGWKWTETAQTVSPFSFTVDYSKIFGGTVTMNDTVQYFVTAQDLFTTPQVSANPSLGFAATTVASVTSAPDFPYAYKIVGAPMSGDYTVGIGEFNRLNNRNLKLETRTRKVTIQVPVDVEVQKNKSELNKTLLDGKSSLQTNNDMKLKTSFKQNDELTVIVSNQGKDVSNEIKEESETQIVTNYVEKEIDQEYTVLVENGVVFEWKSYDERQADGVIEGLYPSISAAIADVNERGVSGPVRLLLTDASYTETYPIVLGNVVGSSAINTITIKPSTSVTTVINAASPVTAMFHLDGAKYFVFDGSNQTSGTTRNMTFANSSSSIPVFRMENDASYNVVKNSVFNTQNTSSTSGAVVLLSTTAAKGNTGNSFLNNQFLDNAGTRSANYIYSSGATALPNDSTTVTGNEFANFTASGVRGATGSGSNWTISNNHFYCSISAASALTPINLTPGIGSVSNSITGNFIGGSAMNAGGTPLVVTSSSSFSGMTVSVDSIISSSVSSNVIRNINLQGTGSHSFTGINATGGSLSISNNIVGDSLSANSILVAGSSTTTGIRVDATNHTNSFTVSGNRIANLNASGTGTAVRVRGIIQDIVNCNASYLNNTIHNLSTQSTGTGIAAGSQAAVGIYIYQEGYVGVHPIVSGNTIYNISADNNTAVATASAGMFCTNFDGVINANKIYNITNLSTGTNQDTPPIAAGLYFRYTGSGNAIINNMISLGDGQTNGVSYIGILNVIGFITNTINVHNNTVSLSGTASADGLNTFAFRRGYNATDSAITTISMKNNIFDNQRTGGTGKHYSIANFFYADGWIANASDYNVLNSSSASTVGNWIDTDQTFDSWKTISGGDSESISGETVTYTSVGNGDLHLNMGTTATLLESGGTIISGLNFDFDGDVRPGPLGSVNGGATAPDLGADEFDGVPAASSTFQLSVNVTNGWNMTSIPGLHPVNQNVNTWWINRNPLADVYKWNGSYTVVTLADPSEGYWMLHTGDQTYNTGEEWPSGGIQIVAHDPIPVINGWNMIGGYESNIPVAGLTTTPPGIIVTNTIYGWNGSYYNPTNLEPGYGYWVLINGGPGVINVPTVIDGSGTIAKQDDRSSWGKIIVTDATGKHFTLYTVNGEVNLDHYQMPPMPPAGAFDVRYSSQRMAENIRTNSRTIEMNSMVYPVTVRIENVSIKLQDETGRIVNTRMKDGEEYLISNSQVSKLNVSENIIPDVYALDQNYPNPFNPSTLIRFSLPEDVSNVTLTIYNALGQKVTELINSKLEAGQYEYRWNANDVASGLYIYELRTEKFSSVKKMMLLK